MPTNTLNPLKFESTSDGSPAVNYVESINNLVGQQGANATGIGQSAFGSGIGALQAMLNYYQNEANGSTSQLLGTPEVQGVLSQYDAARQSMANLNPRGGLRASQGANLKFNELGQIGNLVQKTRQAGAAGASQTAGQITQAGLAESGLGAQDLQTVIQSILAQRQQNGGGSNFGTQLAGAFAGGLGSGLANLLI